MTAGRWAKPTASATSRACGSVSPAVRHAIGADTLGYISQHGMIAATEQPTSRLCTACFDGNYPIELPPSEQLGKHLLETLPGLDVERAGSRDAEGVPTGVAGGAADALARP